MRTLFVTLSLLLVVSGSSWASKTIPSKSHAHTTPLVTSRSLVFPVTPHPETAIEWWYLNAHVKTASGRNLALIGSFFRFGSNTPVNGKAAESSKYLIFALTDLDKGTHVAYSLADRNSLDLLTQALTFAQMEKPNDPRIESVLADVSNGRFPPPTQLIAKTCTIQAKPFSLYYGDGNALQAIPGVPNTYHLTLTGSQPNTKLDLVFSGAKPPMYVNGDGNTGLRTPTDMKYISLTRCNVTGSVDSGNGPDEIQTGQGWFDHQWGNTWTTEHVGWDWWGTQLDNGTDILFFRQRELATGKIFFPLATFEDKFGHLTVTRNIKFTSDPASVWTSPTTNVSYPLRWTVSFPDQSTSLKISAYVHDQEMPVLANGGAIWEGACSVAGNVSGKSVPGTAYMELVGYASPAVKATVKAQPSP